MQLPCAMRDAQTESARRQSVAIAWEKEPGHRQDGRQVSSWTVDCFEFSGWSLFDTLLGLAHLTNHFSSFLMSAKQPLQFPFHLQNISAVKLTGITGRAEASK